MNEYKGVFLDTKKNNEVEYTLKANSFSEAKERLGKLGKTYGWELNYVI